MGLCLYVDLCFHASSLPCLHTFWHAIPTSFYIFNVFYFLVYAAKLVKEAFERVLKDDSFKLKTGFTSYVLSSATTILSQCENAVFLEFSNQLVSSLQKCIPRPNAKQSISKVQRQNMWSDYHHLISSQEFKALWNQESSLPQTEMRLWIECLAIPSMQSCCSNSEVFLSHECCM